MAIGGKEFKIEFDHTLPSLKLDLIAASPDPRIEQRCEIKKILLDTGSDFTLLKNGTIELLRLKWTGNVMDIESFSGEVIPVKFYACKIIIEGILEEIIEVGGIDFDPLVGMDLIKKCHLLINCPNGTFEIAGKTNYKPPLA